MNHTPQANSASAADSSERSILFKKETKPPDSLFVVFCMISTSHFLVSTLNKSSHSCFMTGVVLPLKRSGVSAPLFNLKFMAACRTSRSYNVFKNSHTKLLLTFRAPYHTAAPGVLVHKAEHDSEQEPEQPEKLPKTAKKK